jgi:DNA-binding HxlR family transcriptional regulator
MSADTRSIRTSLEALSGGRLDPVVVDDARDHGRVTVRYTLTPLGHSLAEAVTVIRAWAYANMDTIEAARDAYEPGTGAPPTPVAAPAGQR